MNYLTYVRKIVDETAVKLIEMFYFGEAGRSVDFLEFLSLKKNLTQFLIHDNCI